MGLFDRLYVPCPNCSKPVEFQSKEDECYMNTFSLENAPVAVLYDVMNDPHYCRACGQWLALVDLEHPPGPRPRPQLRVAKVRTPENPDTNEQGFKWWNEPFSFADLDEPLVDNPRHVFQRDRGR